MDQLRTEFLKYLKMISERRYLFILLSLCIMSIIVWGSYFIPKKYEAKSTVFIESNVIEDLVRGIAITPSMYSRIAVLRDTMLGRSLVLNVIRKLDLDTSVESDAELELMISNFQKKARINVRRNNLIKISFVNKNPVLARDFVNTLVSVYVENNVFDKREEAYDATKFLNEQVQFFKNKMDKGEEKVIKYRQEQGIYIAMDERAAINEIKRYHEEIERTKLRVNELNATKESMGKQLENEKPYTVTMFSNKGIDEIIRAHENRLRQLMISYTENYPEVIKLKAEIESLKKRQIVQSETQQDEMAESKISMVNPVYQQLKQKIMEIEAELSALSTKNRDYEALLKKKEDELKNIPESRKKLSDLVKEKDSFRNVYEKLLVRLGQSEVSKQMEIEDKTTTFRIMEPAILPKIPVSPNKKLFIFVGIIAGLLGGFAVVFLLDIINESVKTLEELKTLGLPVLAVIPKIQNLEDLNKIKRRDMLVYSFAGFYMLFILCVLTMEYLGLNYVDEFINNIIRRKYL